MRLSLNTSGPLLGAFVMLHNYIIDSPYQDNMFTQAADDVQTVLRSIEQCEGSNVALPSGTTPPPNAVESLPA